MLAGERKGVKRSTFFHLVLLSNIMLDNWKYISFSYSMISGVENSPYQKRKKKIFLQRNWYFCSEKKGGGLSGGRRLIESRLPFCPGRVIRYIIMATLKKPYCSNLPCIWFEDLQPPPFVPIIISLHFVFHTMEAHILKMFECRQNWWMARCCLSSPVSALEDALWCPMFEEASDAIQEHEKRTAMGKTLENPSCSSFWEDIVYQKKNLQYLFSYLFKIWLEIFYNWEQSTRSLEAVKNSWGMSDEGQKIPVQNDLCWLPQHLQTCWVRFILWCQTQVN